LELQYGDLTLQIPDERWKEVIQAITDKIQNNLELLNKYERGETITASFPITLVQGDKEKEIEVPLEVSKPLPILGKTILELPKEPLKIEFPKEGLKLRLGKLKTSKRITLDKTEMIQIEEGTIEQVEED